MTDTVAVPSRAGRPESYADLLKEPLAQKVGDKDSYTDWEFDHGQTSRFYVGGYRWFMRTVGIYDLSRFSAYGAEAVALVKDKTDWRSMPLSGGDWDACSINQFRSAKDGRPQHFQKAALIIAACESYVMKQIAANELNPEKINVSMIYDRMAIIPAVWRLSDLDKDTVAKIESTPGLIDQIIAKANQENKKFLTEMGQGHTVTHATATQIKKLLDANGIHCGLSTPRSIARGRAAGPSEFVQVG